MIGKKPVTVFMMHADGHRIKAVLLRELRFRAHLIDALLHARTAWWIADRSAKA